MLQKYIKYSEVFTLFSFVVDIVFLQGNTKGGRTVFSKKIDCTEHIPDFLYIPWPPEIENKHR